MNKLFVPSLIYFSILLAIQPITLPPTWVTSNYIKASSYSIINGTSTIGASSPTPTATMAFSSAFSSIPNLGYGVLGYQSKLIVYLGSDNLGEQMYEVNRTALSETSFSVLVKISGNTDIWIVRIRYVGVDKLFPHHLNSFDNVPCNYNNGALTTFSSASSTPKTYTNNINYTLQAQSIGSNYTTFSTPLTYNKILLFMTSMFLDGKGEKSSDPFNPIDLKVTAIPTSPTIYTITVSLGVQVIITRLHYSMIIFDSFDVQFTGFYFLICDRYDFQTSGGSVEIPIQFVPNSIMSFTDFYSYRTEACITFFLNYQTLSNGKYGIHMPASAPRDTGRNKITRFGFTLFYLKSWVCPTGYYLDLATNLCTDCTIINCAQCLNLTYCKTCKAGYQTNIGQCSPIPCTLSNCISCITASQCGVCNNISSFYLSNGSCLLCNMSNRYYINNGSCIYCNNTLNQFINASSFTCQACNIAQCLVCSSLTSCSACNNSNTYFLSQIDLLCYHCNITNCNICQSFTQCLTCVQGYLLNINLGSCQACTLLGCSICNDSNTCLVCDSASNYILSPVNYTCLLCNIGQFANSNTNSCQSCLIPGCMTCLNLTTCQTCNNSLSYYIDQNFTCVYCDPLLNKFANLSSGLCELCSPIGCTTCESLLRCSICNFGFLLNNTSGQCEVCNLTGCSICSTLTECNICNGTGNYILSNNTCQLCLASSDYFANETINQCQLCSLSQCLVCLSLTNCQTCNQTNYYYANNGSCIYCNPIQNFFINSITFQCQLCQIQGCLTCTSLNACQTCNILTHYLLNSTDNLCYLCNLQYCIQCQSQNKCKVCNQTLQYFLNLTTGLCQQCSISECLNCSSLTVCRECDLTRNFGLDFTSPNVSLCGSCNVSCVCGGYKLPWDPILQTCTPACGDGKILLDQQCDDSNNMSGDGCSSNCRFEQNYNCTGEPSNCSSRFFVIPEVISIEKQGCNGFKIKLDMVGLSLAQISSEIAINNEGINIKRTQQQSNNLIIYVQYIRDVINETIELKVVGKILNIKFDPMQPSLHYSESECTTLENMKQLLMVNKIGSYPILIISLLSCKIVGLQLFGVLQISYFTLASHSFLNLYLSPLIDFKITNGMNLKLTSQNNQRLPKSMKQMGVSSSFINNVNIMLIIVFVYLFITVVLYIFSRITKNQKLRRSVLYFIKQGSITLILFSSFNFSFSAGVHLKYSDPQDPFYVLSCVTMTVGLLTMIIASFIMEFTQQDTYGQFKGKFKKNFVCQLFIPITVLYRLALGLYIGFRNEQSQSTLLILGFSLIFGLYFIANLPYSDFYHNYRSGMIHLTMLIILFTANYYREMKQPVALQVKARIFTPSIIQIVLIVICVIVSGISACYQLFMWIKRKCKGNKTKNQDTGMNAPPIQMTQSSDIEFH